MTKQTRQLIFILTLSIGLTAPTILAGALGYGWFWMGIVLSFFVSFGIMEAWSRSVRGKAVSLDVWDFSEERPVLFWISMIMWVLAWLSLIWHFAEKALY